MGKDIPEKMPKTMAGITRVQDFEVVEMTDLSGTTGPGVFTSTTSYSISTHPRPITTARHKVVAQNMVDSFKRAPGPEQGGKAGYYSPPGMPNVSRGLERRYDLPVATARTASTSLVRDLKGRHLQMIAIGGSIGTGLFVTSGVTLSQSGPGSMLLAYALTGVMQYCTMQSLAELAVVFPISGSFSAFSTRFLDPSWGFAMGWNYAFQWLTALPLEIMAGALTVKYWNDQLSTAIFVTIFLLAIVVINLFGIKGYGEAEFIFSIVKVTAIIGFILLGIVVNIGGSPHGGYIGGRYWTDPGAMNNGFKGFCSVLVASTFAFSGTELVGLAAAETANPRKSIPSAIKKVFWRIAVFYIVALLLVSLLVPYNNPRLLGARSSVDTSASPFVLAVESIGKTILPSVMNAVILVAVLSVGNSAVFGASRTLASLAEQSHAPRMLGYVDRKGRPIVSVLFSLAMGLLAYLVDVKVHDEIFGWLVAVCGLSSLFTWASICFCHIRFRQAWKVAGYNLDQLPFQSQVGVVGSILGFSGNILIFVSQLWIALSPVGETNSTSVAAAKTFFLQILAAPIVVLFYLGHKAWFRTKIIRTRNMDIDTGRNYAGFQSIHVEDEVRYQKWPLWKRLYRSFC